LTSVNFQLFSNAAWATQHTVTYDYTNSVTRDATSQWFVPQSSTEWTELLAGSDIPNPTNMWKCQESVNPLNDSIGTISLSDTGHTSGISFNQAVTGWTRKAVAFTDAATGYFASSSGICNPANTTCTVFGLVK